VRKFKALRYEVCTKRNQHADAPVRFLDGINQIGNPSLGPDTAGTGRIRRDSKMREYLLKLVDHDQNRPRATGKEHVDRGAQSILTGLKALR
jgi:hypothetical protein